jgi:alpha-1,6-mannosyltransferase
MLTTMNQRKYLENEQKCLRIVLPAGLILLLLASLHVPSADSLTSYALVFILSSGVFVWLAYEAGHAKLPRWVLLALLFAAIIVRGSFLFTLPLGSDDIYRYLWDGKVQAAGIDPYRFAPGDPALSGLSSRLLPSSVNHPELKSVYFPVSQWIFFLSYTVAGESVWGFKLLLLIAETLTIVALWQLLMFADMPRTGVLMYALCPLPILQFAFDGHLDGMGLPLLAFAVLLYLKKRRIAAMLLLGISLAIKPVALVLIPIFLFNERGWKERLTVLLVPFLPFVLQLVPYLGSSNPFEGLLTFSRHWTFNGVAFELVDAFLANNLPSRLVCAGCLAVSLVILYASSIGIVRKLYLAIFLLMIFSPVVHPWYVCWLLIFLPSVRPWSGIVFGATACLTVFTVVSYRSSGAWIQHPLILAAEYLPVLILLTMEVRMWQREAAIERSSL